MPCLSSGCAHDWFLHSERFSKVVGALRKRLADQEENSLVVLRDEDFDCVVWEMMSPLPVVVGDGAKLVAFGSHFLCRQSEKVKYMKPDGTFDPAWRTYMENKL